MSKRIAIIPARGGSKRIPKKNIINFNGKPMISWTIEAALNTGLFDKVLVSTDCPEIAIIAQSAGASVPFFRLDNNDDHAPISHATISALGQAEKYWKTRYEVIVQLMVNCPLRRSKHIHDAILAFENNNFQYQISCFRFGWMNPWWAAKLDKNFKPTQLFKGKNFLRSQDLEPLYCPTGAIWIANHDSLISAGTFYGPDHRYYPMEWSAAVDIDDFEDLKMANNISFGNSLSVKNPDILSRDLINITHINNLSKINKK